MQEVRDSIEVENETPISGDVRNATSEEIKQRIYDTFPNTKPGCNTSRL